MPTTVVYSAQCMGYTKRGAAGNLSGGTDTKKNGKSRRRSRDPDRDGHNDTAVCPTCGQMYGNMLPPPAPTPPTPAPLRPVPEFSDVMLPSFWITEPEDPITTLSFLLVVVVLVEHFATIR